MAVSSVAVVRAIVSGALPGVPVSQTISDRSQRMIRVDRVGGRRGREVDEARILVECFAATASGAPDGPRAEQDALAVYDALRLSPGRAWGGGWVADFDGNSIVDYPDPTQSKYARWQFTGVLYIMLNQH